MNTIDAITHWQLANVEALLAQIVGGKDDYHESLGLPIDKYVEARLALETLKSAMTVLKRGEIPQ